VISDTPAVFVANNINGARHGWLRQVPTGGVWRYHNICGCSWGSWTLLGDTRYNPHSKAGKAVGSN